MLHLARGSADCSNPPPPQPRQPYSSQSKSSSCSVPLTGSPDSITHRHAARSTFGLVKLSSVGKLQHLKSTVNPTPVKPEVPLQWHREHAARIEVPGLLARRASVASNLAAISRRCLSTTAQVPRTQALMCFWACAPRSWGCRASLAAKRKSEAFALAVVQALFCIESIRPLTGRLLYTWNHSATEMSIDLQSSRYRLIFKSHRGRSETWDDISLS